MTNNRRSSLKIDGLAKRIEELKRGITEDDVELNSDIDKNQKFPNAQDSGKNDASKFKK
jgi:hypothetical protein